MLSFWEKSSFIQYDYIIVGGGITGLSTACAIKEKKPKASVLVLERGLLPTGASTKNAGFACIGSFSEKLADLERLGESGFLKLIEDRWVGLYLLRKRLGDDNIDFLNHGGFELVMNEKEETLHRIEEMNNLLQPLFKKQVFYLAPQFIGQFGFNASMVHNMIFNPFEGQVDTGKMMKTLLNYTGILQVRVLSGANVTSVQNTSQGVEVECDNLGSPVRFRGGQAVICTNAFAGRFLPGEEIMPGRGQVLCTSEIPDLKFTGIFHFDEGYYYFRNIGKRVIFGGGRNLDFEGETTSEFALNDRIQKQLDYFLEEMILPGTDYRVEHRWCGIMAFNGNKTPLVKRVNEHVVVGARLNGMGVALASKIADDLTTLLDI